MRNNTAIPKCHQLQRTITFKNRPTQRLANKRCQAAITQLKNTHGAIAGIYENIDVMALYPK